MLGLILEQLVKTIVTIPDANRLMLLLDMRDSLGNTAVHYALQYVELCNR